jgi:hypothetical protein
MGVIEDANGCKGSHAQTNAFGVWELHCGGVVPAVVAIPKDVLNPSN